MVHKQYLRKDLESMEKRTDLTPEERRIALKIYWSIHMHPILFRDSLYDDKLWTPDLIPSVPDPHSHLAKKRPLLLWCVLNCVILMCNMCIRRERWLNYAAQRWETVFLAVWTESATNAVLFFGKFPDDGELRFHRIISGTVHDISKEFSPSIMEHNAEEFSVRSYIFDSAFNLFIWNTQIYCDITQRYGDILEICAANVIESVKVSLGPKTAFGAIKHYCDHWHQDSQNFTPSKIAKVAVIRALRRITRFLLSDEISSQSIFGTADTNGIYRRDANFIQYNQNRPTIETPAQDIAPKYWPLYLIEKSCFMADPLSKILTALLRSTIDSNSNAEILQNITDLAKLGVDLSRLDQSIAEFRSKPQYASK